MKILFLHKMGMPGQIAKPDWIMGGKLRPDVFLMLD
jgi:hypothetical protein